MLVRPADTLRERFTQKMELILGRLEKTNDDGGWR